MLGSCTDLTIGAFQLNKYFLDFLKYLVTDKNGIRLDKEDDNQRNGVIGLRLDKIYYRSNPIFRCVGRRFHQQSYPEGSLPPAW